MKPMRLETRFKQLPRFSKKIIYLLGLFGCSILLIWGMEQLLHSPIYQTMQEITFVTGEFYDRWFKQQAITNPILLIGLAFLGGLVASISPCILSLLPVNLSYIGTREINSRREALIKASAFVLGVVTVLSLLGMFSALAGFVFVQFRGYVHLVVGAIIVLMGLSLAGIVTVPLPSNSWLRSLSSAAAPLPNQSVWAGLRRYAIGPFTVGLTFALVSSPCTSPVMVSVLAAGAATGSQFQSVLVMVSYALGYTAIIFLASLFAGLAKQTHRWLVHSEAIVRVASLVLLLTGLFYLITGGQWVFFSWQH